MKKTEIATKLHKWDSYIALGDSHTEGMMDCPDEKDTSAVMIGWADRLAAEISARRQELGFKPIRYANLAIRGKKLAHVKNEQFNQALKQKPALISIVAGGNDIIRPSANPDYLARCLESLVIQSRKCGIDVLLGTVADPKGSPVISLVRPRIATLNAHIWSIARRHDCYVVDMWGLRTLRTKSAWAVDRLHLSKYGHKLLTQAALIALGLENRSTKFDSYKGQDLSSWTVKQNINWTLDYFIPWANRHLHGRSSGDGMEAKRPTLEFFQSLPDYDL